MFSQLVNIHTKFTMFTDYNTKTKNNNLAKPIIDTVEQKLMSTADLLSRWKEKSAKLMDKMRFISTGT